MHYKQQCTNCNQIKDGKRDTWHTDYQGANLHFVKDQFPPLRTQRTQSNSEKRFIRLTQINYY